MQSHTQVEQQTKAKPIWKWFKKLDMKSLLRVTTGVPLFVGILLIVSINIYMVEQNAPNWMSPVTESLEKEEINSLSRLSSTQAGFANEIMSQMFEEVELVTGIMSNIFNNNTNRTPGVMPDKMHQYSLPMGTQDGVLNYNQYSVDDTPLGSTCSSTRTKSCWSDPEYPLTKGRVANSQSSSSGDKGSVSLLTTALYWPGPSARGNLSPAPTSEYRDTGNLPPGLRNEIDLTSYITDLFRETFESNPAIEFMYIGTSNYGVFRSYPYGHSVGRVTKFRVSARDGETRLGYDPRHRPWYYQCEQAKLPIVTPPYIDATTDELVITVAAPILDSQTGKVLAVIGYDVSIDALASLVSSSRVLVNGYAYVVAAEQGYTYYSELKKEDDTGKLIVHPKLTPSDIGKGNTKLLDWEFQNPEEKEAFSSKVFSEMKDLSTTSSAVGEFEKGGKTWHIAYCFVPAAKYVLAFVVPDDDIKLPATHVLKMIQDIVVSQSVTFVAIVLVGVGIFFWMQIELAHFVVQPVIMLKNVIELIIIDLNRSVENNEQKKGKDKKNKPRFALHVNELIKPEDEGCLEISMMKESFEHMLMALRFGSDAFDRNDFDAAIKIYEEAMVMFTDLHNLRGAGIAAFNVGVVCHKKWLFSEKKDMAALRKADKMYLSSIANGRDLWNEIVQRDVDGVTIDVAGENTGIQMVQRVPNEPRTISAVALSEEEEDAEGNTIKPKRLVGNDFANKLAGRLHTYARLLVDTCDPANYDLALPYVAEALNIDTETHNVLGYSSRIGLYGEILVAQGNFSLAEQKIMSQLSILRQRIKDFYRAEDRRYMSQKGLKKSESEAQEVEQLFQALQNGLIDAGDVMAIGGEHDRMALSLYREALSCSERTKEHTINLLFLKLKTIVDRNENSGLLSNKFIESFQAEIKRRNLQSAAAKQILFVVDYSGSMAGGKMRRSRKGITEVVSTQMTPEDYGGIIQFNSKVKCLLHLTNNHDKILNAVNRLSKPCGGTALWDAVGSAIFELMENSQSDTMSKWLVIVSDGADNRSSLFSVNKLAKSIREKQLNIVILSVGVDEPSAIANMKKLTDASTEIGELIEVSSSEEIDEAFSRIKNLVGGNLEIQRY